MEPSQPSALTATGLGALKEKLGSSLGDQIAKKKKELMFEASYKIFQKVNKEQKFEDALFPAALGHKFNRQTLAHGFGSLTKKKKKGVAKRWMSENDGFFSAESGNFTPQRLSSIFRVDHRNAKLKKQNSQAVELDKGLLEDSNNLPEAAKTPDLKDVKQTPIKLTASPSSKGSQFLKKQGAELLRKQTSRMISKLDEVVEEDVTNSEVVPSATVPSREIPSKGAPTLEPPSQKSSKRKTIPTDLLKDANKMRASIEGIAKASDKVGRSFVLNTNRSKRESMQGGTISSEHPHSITGKIEKKRGSKCLSATNKCSSPAIQLNEDSSSQDEKDPEPIIEDVQLPLVEPMSSSPAVEKQPSVVTSNIPQIQTTKARKSDLTSKPQPPTKKRISQNKLQFNSTRTSIKKATPQQSRPSHITSERPSQNLGDTLKSQFARGTEFSYNQDSDYTTPGGIMEARHPQVKMNPQQSMPTEVQEVPEETPKAQVTNPHDYFSHGHTHLSGSPEMNSLPKTRQQAKSNLLPYPLSSRVTESMSYCNDPNCLQPRYQMVAKNNQGLREMVAQTKTSELRMKKFQKKNPRNTYLTNHQLGLIENQLSIKPRQSRRSDQKYIMNVNGKLMVVSMQPLSSYSPPKDRSSSSRVKEGISESKKKRRLQKLKKLAVGSLEQLKPPGTRLFEDSTMSNESIKKALNKPKRSVAGKEGSKFFSPRDSKMRTRNDEFDYFGTSRDSKALYPKAESSFRPGDALSQNTSTDDDHLYSKINNQNLYDFMKNKSDVFTPKMGADRPAYLTQKNTARKPSREIPNDTALRSLPGSRMGHPQMTQGHMSLEGLPQYEQVPPPFIAPMPQQHQAPAGQPQPTSPQYIHYQQSCYQLVLADNNRLSSPQNIQQQVPPFPGNYYSQAPPGYVPMASAAPQLLPSIQTGRHAVRQKRQKKKHRVQEWSQDFEPLTNGRSRQQRRVLSNESSASYRHILSQRDIGSQERSVRSVAQVMDEPKGFPRRIRAGSRF